MRTAHDLLTNERRAWTDESARAFLKNVILPRCKPAQIAYDAAPAKSEPTFEQAGWMTAINPDRNAMDEAATIASLYEGKPFGEGRRLHDEFILRRKIGGSRGV